MTDPLDYIRDSLPHDDGCPDGDPDLIPFKPDGSFGDIGPCNCRRAEVIAWLDDALQWAQAEGYRAGRESMKREAAECVWQGSALPMLEEGENWTQEAVDAVAAVRQQMLAAIEALPAEKGDE